MSKRTEISSTIACPGVWCHSTKNTRIVSPILYLFYGYDAAKLEAIFQRMIIGGLLGMYNNFLEHYLNHYTVRSAASIEGFNDGDKPEPFDISDWKILSIFVVWAALLSLTKVVFLLEMHFRKAIKFCLELLRISKAWYTLLDLRLRNVGVILSFLFHRIRK